MSLNPLIEAEILRRSNYPTDALLTEEEVKDLLQKHSFALNSTNGDTGEIKITARQLILLLRNTL